MKLILSTNNLHKLREVREIIGPQIELLSLSDIGFSGDIPEDQDTLEGNASQKSHYIYNTFKENCFADDTGLEVGSAFILSNCVAGRVFIRLVTPGRIAATSITWRSYWGRWMD